MDIKYRFLLPYSKLRPKLQNYLREDSYFNYLLTADISMFTYTGLPESIDPRYLEIYLRMSRSAGIKRYGDEYRVCADPVRDGQLDQYGDGEHMEGITANGLPVSGTIGEDCVIIYNNPTRTPEIDLYIDTDGFCMIDKSVGINVKLSRIAPVYHAGSTVKTEQLTEMLKSIIDGNLYTISSTGQKFDGLSVKGEDPVEMIDVNKPERAQYLQYLLEAWDVLQRRHFARRGLAAKTSSKHAQVSQDEVHGLDCISWYYPLAMLAERKKGVEMLNRVYGLSGSVDFSDLWRQEYESYQLRTLQQDRDAETAADEMRGGQDDGDPQGTDRSSSGSSDSGSEPAAEP